LITWLPITTFWSRRDSNPISETRRGGIRPVRDGSAREADLTASGHPTLKTSGITKTFGGVVALNSVDLTVREGDVHALLGQNGAGKSTLIKVLNGVYAAGSFSGTLAMEGREVSFASPRDAAECGIGYVPQETEVFEHLSVAENVFAGMTGGSKKARLVNRREIGRRSKDILAGLGISIDPNSPAARLTSAEKHMLMIARALARRPRVLLLDEPTAALSSTEVKSLFEALSRLRSEGVTTVYITHRLPEVMAICDRTTVLRDGIVAAEFDRKDFDEDAFIFAMSGRKLSRLFPVHDAPPNAPNLLKVEGLVPGAGHGKVGIHREAEVSFSVASGEIVGLAGLLGSGRSEILHAIFGSLPAKGTISVDGDPVAIRRPRDARRAGIALLTEERKRDGLLFNLSLGRNITIGNLGPLSKAGFVNPGREGQAVRKSMEALNVVATSPAAALSSLSGGNQQKLLFSRALMREPRILMLDEPTRGVDAATRQEIYKLTVDLAAKGAGLLIVSSELEEIIGLCTRILTVSDGRIVDEFKRGEGDEERVLRAIADAQGRQFEAAA